jgi:drug/metabolite transporter (DMT)-like permease
MLERTHPQQRLALTLIWLVPSLWTVNYIVARLAPGVIGPYMLALGRWAIAGIVLVALCAPELWRQRRHIAQVWWQYLVLGLLGMFICGAWVYQGARSTGAMNIALIYAASPVMIALGAGLWLGEAFGRRQAVGVVLALAGVLHVIVRGHWAALADLQFVPGDAWVLAATISWAAFALLQKHWPSPLGATARLATICVGGVLLLLPVALWEMTQPDLMVWNSQALWLVLVAAAVPGLGAYWIYGWAQRVVGASRVAVALYLGPLYASGAAWWMLGEPPGWHHLVGALLILPGVFLVTQARAAPVTPAVAKPPQPVRS